MADDERKTIGMDPTTPGFSNQRLMKRGAIKSMMSNPGVGIGLKRAIVAEVITNPEDLFVLLDEDDNHYAGKIQNEQDARRASRNSLLVKIIEKSSEDKFICAFPFLSSHIMFPINVGEQVWLMKESDHYYWLSRIAGVGEVEDVNFTHKERELILPARLGKDAKEKADTASGESGNFIPKTNNGFAGEHGGFANHAKDADSVSLQSNQQFVKGVKEPVPRFTPRPGDLVLQGSNNTLITLGTDRGWSKNDEDFSVSNALDEIEAGRGSIDIVVGRSALEEPATPTDENALGSDPTRTAPRLVTTAEGDSETDKQFALNEQEAMPCEGDPDFHSDSSRIYLSMNTAVDEKLAITEEYRDPMTGTIDDVEAAAIALKSNEIRIVAREDGSIRLLKETGEGTGGSIIIHPDGAIHISGEIIYMGDPGGSGDGEGGSEPYIKYSNLKTYLEDVHSSIDSFCQTLLSHVTPGYGSPSPQIIQAAGTLKAEMAAHKAKIGQFPSSRIFGE